MELLTVKGLDKKYKTVHAVKGIDFHVNQGEILGLLGPNGAGKSTTISMISTLLKPDGGDILYNSESIIKKPKAIQENLGYVPQEIALYPMLSGKENLIFWGRAYGLKGATLKKAVKDVSEIIGIDNRLKDKVKTYSGGMKRRLNIGVALLHNPELIIMDEPTVGIDPQSRKHILDTVLLLNKEKGMTVIYTSHYMEEVEYLCNRICIMDQGQIIAEGTKEELIKANNPKVEIHVKVNKDHEKVADALNALSNVDQAEVIEETIQLTTGQDEKIFKDLIDTIALTGATILSMDVKEPNLETVFLNLTGRALRD